MTEANIQEYEGHRILEAMRSAPHYADAIYRRIKSANTNDGPLLDFGAGDGLFAELFLKDGTRVECVEPDPKNIAALSALGVKAVPDIGLLPDNHFGFAYTINVLEHLHDVDRHLREIYRVLRKDGLLFVFVPAFNVLWTSLDDEVAHVQRFTRGSLRKPLEEAGFRAEQLRYFDSAGFPAALTVRVLERFGLFNYSPNTVGFYDRTILPISLMGDNLLSGLLGKNVIATARKL